MRVFVLQREEIQVNKIWNSLVPKGAVMCEAQRHTGKQWRAQQKINNNLVAKRRL